MSGKLEKKVKGTAETFTESEDVAKVHVKPIKCLNERQKQLIKTIDEKEVTICSGLAGSGKTFMSLWLALKMLEKKQVERIVLVKSVTTVPNEEIGYLRGSLEEKMEPFMISFFGNIDKLIGERQREKLVEDGKIVVQPIAYLRGVNIDRSIVLLDEAQNITIPTFKTIITRIGEGSKYVILGDTEQVDMKRREESALSKLIDLFTDDEIVGVCSFTDADCVRNPIIPHMLDKIKSLEMSVVDASLGQKKKK